MSLTPSPAELFVINGAYALIGQPPLQTIDVETPGAQAAALLYVDTAKALLGFYPWSFSKRTRKLDRLADDPGDGWTYAFQLPADRIGQPLAVSNVKDLRRQFTDYALAEDRVHADVAELWAQVQYVASPSTWSGPFLIAFRTALAAEFAMAITQDAKLRAQLRQDAFGPDSMMMRGGFMGAAIQADTRAQPSPVLLADGGPLLQARRGGLYDYPEG